MGSDLIGFDAQEIKILVNSIKQCRNNCVNNYKMILQNNVIYEIGNIWFSPQTKKYVKQFVRDAQDVEKNMTNIFNEFIEYLNNQMKKWHNEMGINVKYIKPLNYRELYFDLSNINDTDKLGNCGINLARCNQFLQNINIVENNIKTVFLENQNRLQVEQVFLGINQSSAIEMKYNKMINSLDRLFNDLKVKLEREISTVNNEYTMAANQNVDEFL